MPVARPLVPLLLAALAGPAVAQVSFDAGPPRTVTPYRGRGVTVLTDLPAGRAQRLTAAVSNSAVAAAAALGARRAGSVTVLAWDDASVWPTAQLPTEAQAALRTNGAYLWKNTTRSGTTFTYAGIPVGGNVRNNAAATFFGKATDGVAERGAAEAVLFNVAEGAPNWYVRGVAEAARYATANDPAVRISDADLNFLTAAPGRAPTPRQTAELDDVSAGGDDRVRAAVPWRWALVHLAANNPNYSGRFARVGPALAAGRVVTFTDAFGPVEPQLNFEYAQFLAHLEQGLRADLTAWDWRASPRPLTRRASARVDSKGGWQATRVGVAAGMKVRYSCSGDWSVGEDAPRPAAVDPAAPVDPDREEPPRRRPDGEDLTADGGADGRGRLVGAIFDPAALTLSDEFELGAGGTFAAPAAGHLMLRCRDEWGQLDDNRGRIVVTLQPAD